MKRFAALCLAALCLAALTACGGETASRAETVRAYYAAHPSYTAAAEVERVRDEGNARYTLRFDADGEETRVTVLAPELLAGVTARLSEEALKLEYDGLVLDAGGSVDGVSAVNCVPLALRALAGGYLLEENEETIERGGESVRALRVCLESEADGGALRCTLWLGEDDAPLRAEIEENEKITAFMEFTSFSFCDTIPKDNAETG